MRGPGIEPATVVDEIILNVDLAPTFLAIAGVPTPTHMDGRSFLPLLSRNRNIKDRWPDTFLIESSGRREPLHGEHGHHQHHNHQNHGSRSGAGRKNSHLTTSPNSTHNMKERLNNETTVTTSTSAITTTDENAGIDFGSHEHDDDDDEDDSKLKFFVFGF